MKTEEQIRGILGRILSQVSAAEAQVSYHGSARLATRFGENAITQNLGNAEENLRLVVANGKRHGSSITNKLDDEALRGLVRRAEDIAATSPEDPEYMPALGPQEYPDVPRRHFDDVVALTPVDLADGIAAVVKMARKEGYKASGLYSATSGAGALATSKGLFAFDRSTGASFSTTMHGAAGSGQASRSVNTAAKLDAEAIAREALDTAIAAQNPIDVEPGDYTVIFEPQAVADLLGFVFWIMDARDADEGTTAFAGKAGEKFLHESVTVRTEIDRPELPACPYGEDGLPARCTTWIERGVVNRLKHDRFWAREKKTDPDPSMSPLFMEGSDRSVSDLVGQCGRGLLVKRLWYIRFVDEKELLLTGMTRDGLFLVEDGRIAGPVKNLRFNESPIVFLQNVVAMSRPERVGRECVPGIMSEGFTFSSGTESV